MTHPSDAALWTARLVGVFSAVAAGVYALVDLEPRPLVALFLTVGPLFAVIAWLEQDARRTRVALVHDWGWFLYLAWPALVPWYAYRTRGRDWLAFGFGVVLLIKSGALGAMFGTQLHATLWPDF